MTEDTVGAGRAELVVKDDEHEIDIELLLARLPPERRRLAVHVGAHVGEEVPAYFRHGFGGVVVVEANPEACAELRRRFGEDARVSVIEAAAVDRPGPLAFHLHTSRTGSVEAASVLPMKELKEIVTTMHTPRTLTVRGARLDDLLGERSIRLDECDLLNLDVQGAELLALRGAPRLLAACRWLIAEVNRREFYEGGAREEDIERFLAQHGFARLAGVYHRYYDEQGWFVAWGEVLFERNGRAEGTT